MFDGLPVNAPFDDAGTPIDRFSTLWCAVLARTARDALGQFPASDVPAGMTRADIAADARRFFEGAEQFPASTVVELAGFDPAFVASRAQRLDWESLVRPPR